ncbi:MAG: prepilin peptidase [Chloroflexi bacterium]|nr:prepilin peptidase [Chloroflexota bacterium]
MRAVLLLAAAIAASVALVTDLRSRRIPNWLTATTFVGGVLANLGLGGLDGGLSALAGAGLGFLVLIPFYALRGVGAGDVKLLAALGALVGPHDLVSVAVYGALVGGFMSLVVLARSGILAVALHQVFKLRMLPTVWSGARAPYAVALASGVYLAMLLPPVLR